MGNSLAAETTTPDTSGAVTDPDVREWIAIHIYYTSNPNPLLVHAVGPLVEELRQKNLIEHYFFIRYWLEGPHVRLRLLPKQSSDADEVCRIAEEHIESFLHRRPAVYEVDLDVMADIYKQMYLSEYTEEQWNTEYGADGQMPTRANNTWAYVPYAPEYVRYGGAHGIELAEWHFEASSDMVLSLVGRTNVHVRTVLLGLATQVMMTMGSILIRDPEELATFFEGYGQFWEVTYEEQGTASHTDFDRLYEDMSENLVPRIREIHRCAMSPDVEDAFGAFLGPWAKHCVELRAGIEDYVAKGMLSFRARDGSGEYGPTDDPALARQVLLGAYLHMTNNRLGVVINDEAYLAYVLNRAVCDAFDLNWPT